jgi:hypothetical protein
MASISIFILGMLSYKENLLPRKIIHEIKSSFFSKNQPIVSELNQETLLKTAPRPKIRILPYAQGTLLFSDRNYEDTVGSRSLNSSYVIQIPRHFDGNITLSANERIIIYRLISSENNNQVFSDWNQTEIPVLVDGTSANHSSVISKNFQPGDITLYSGGPVCSSPILVKRTEITKSAPPFSIK